jgi:hypothetical protein
MTIFFFLNRNNVKKNIGKFREAAISLEFSRNNFPPEINFSHANLRENEKREKPISLTGT